MSCVHAPASARKKSVWGVLSANAAGFPPSCRRFFGLEIREPEAVPHAGGHRCVGSLAVKEGHVRLVLAGVYDVGREGGARTR